MNLSVETLYSLFNNAPNTILIVDGEGIIQTLNRPLGSGEIEAASGRLVTEYVAPDHRAVITALLQRVWGTRRSESVELEVLTPRDEWGWYLANVGPITNNGDTVALSLFLTDISEKKKAQEAREASENKLKTLIDNIPGMVYRGDAQWKTGFLKGSEELCGYNASEIDALPQSWASVVHPEDREAMFKECAILNTKPTSLFQSYRIVTKDGEVRWVEDYKASIHNDSGEFEGADGIVFDITERKRTAAELKRAQEKLIEQQARALQELSTPVIEIWEEVLVCPLIGTIDTARAQQILEALLETIVTKQSTVVILDITGVPVIDTQVANHLMLTVSAARLIGADVILTGVSSHNASTLAKLGVDMSGIITKGSLQQGLKVALSLTNKKIVATDSRSATS